MKYVDVDAGYTLNKILLKLR